VWLDEQPVASGPCEEAESGVRVLVADDDDTVRRLYMSTIVAVPGISSLVEASNGHDAVRIARGLRCDIAILDFNMPRLNGVDAALLLRRDCPSTRVAVHSADPRGLEERAAGLGLTLFDKLALEHLLGWIERQADDVRALGSVTVAALARRRDFSCSLCGYGLVSREPPTRCPICRRETTWDPAGPEAAENGNCSFG
jgi:chemotaxis response regulator CheB